MGLLVKAALAAFLALIIGGAAMAQNADKDESMINMLFGETPVTAESFAPDFLNAIPFEQVRSLIEATRKQIGPVLDVEETSGGYRIETATHQMDVKITLDGRGRVAGLLLQPAVATAQTIEELAAELAVLPGNVAYLVTRNGDVVVAKDADKALAVGSAFKLGVLAALKDRIEAGTDRWEDVARLEARQVSLPSGILQTFAVGSPVTLSTLATLMISISDNTATDVLLDHVGREAVAKRLGVDFVPKTRELFMLKADKTLRERYLAADVAGKLALAREMDGRSISLKEAELTPHDDGVEWYVPLNRLCELAVEVKDLDPMRAAPGPAGDVDWAQVAYKGGSEVGVLNMTTAAVSRAGDVYCVAMTWNNGEALDAAKAVVPYGGILAKLAR